MIKFNGTINEIDGQVWFAIEKDTSYVPTAEEQEMFFDDIAHLADTITEKDNRPVDCSKPVFKAEPTTYGKLPDMKKICDNLNSIGIGSQEINLESKMDEATHITIKGFLH